MSLCSLFATIAVTFFKLFVNEKKENKEIKKDFKEKVERKTEEAKIINECASEILENKEEKKKIDETIREVKDEEDAFKVASAIIARNNSRVRNKSKK